jgi:hypothetical protein
LAQIEDIVSEKAVEHRPAVQWRDFQIVLAAAVALLALILLGERIPLLQPIRLVLGLAAGRRHRRHRTGRPEHRAERRPDARPRPVAR